MILRLVPNLILPQKDSYFGVQFSRMYVTLTTVLLTSPNGKRTTILMWTILDTTKINDRCALIFVTLFVANMTNWNSILSDIKPCFYQKNISYFSTMICKKHFINPCPV
jgi:hypothetical protein